MRGEEQRIVIALVGGQFFARRDQRRVLRQAQIVVLDLFGRSAAAGRRNAGPASPCPGLPARRTAWSAECAPARSCLRAWSARAGCPRNSQTRPPAPPESARALRRSRARPSITMKRSGSARGQRQIALAHALVKRRAFFVDARFRAARLARLRRFARVRLVSRSISIRTVTSGFRPWQAMRSSSQHDRRIETAAAALIDQRGIGEPVAQHDARRHRARGGSPAPHSAPGWRNRAAVRCAAGCRRWRGRAGSGGSAGRFRCRPAPPFRPRSARARAAQARAGGVAWSCRSRPCLRM